MSEQLIWIAVEFTRAGFHFIWEGAVIGLVASFLAYYLRKQPAKRHAVLLAAMVLLAACIPVNLAILAPSKAPTANSIAEYRAENPEPVAQTPASVPADWGAAPSVPVAVSAAADERIAARRAHETTLAKFAPFVLGVYLIGLVVMSVRLGFAFVHSRRLRANSKPIDEPAWIDALERICKKLQLKSKPAIAWSKDVAAPMVIGIVKPIVLLPISLSLKLSTEQAESILAHELAHLRRLDPWILAFQRIVETLLFFHPAVWWISKQLEKAREEACDDLVVESGACPADYAETLLLCSQFRLESGDVGPLELAATGAPLKERILRLLGQADDNGLRPSRYGWLVVGATALVVVVAAIAIPASSWRDREEARWIEQLGAGDPATVGAAIDKLVNRGPDVAPKLIPLLARGGSDLAALKVLEQLATEPKVQQLLIETASTQPYNPRHCALVALGKSGNRDHAKFIARYLSESPISAMHGLRELGGPEAAEQLHLAFDHIPTDRWFILAGILGDLEYPSSLDVLKQRLSDVILPPTDEFPPATAPSFARAIQKLETNSNDRRVRHHSFSQGQHFAYPYDEPGTPKTFSVTQPADHFIELPEVDPTTDAGRVAIFETLRDETDGPGFTIDGDHVVAFNGLSVAPLWPEGRPYPGTVSDYVSSNPHWILRDQVLGWQTDGNVEDGPVEHSSVMPIPADGLVVGITPDDHLMILNLERTSEAPTYTIGIQRLDPSYQLVSAGKETGPGIHFGQKRGLPLVDHRKQLKDTAFRLDIARLGTVTEELLEDPGGVPYLALETDGLAWSLLVPGASHFLMVENRGVWDDAELTVETLEQATRGAAPLAADQTPFVDNGALHHRFSTANVDREFAFAIQMPNGESVAGVFQVSSFNLTMLERPGARLLYKFLPNASARAVFED